MVSDKEPKVEIEERVVRTGHIEGTLAWPKVAPSDAPPRIVFILHGLAGHRDYCYQKELGQEIARRLGYASFRIDFRNCGESDPVPNPRQGRSIEHTDFEDINEIYNYFCRDRNYELLSVVAHSRGATAMFHWALRVQHEVRIPSLINVSGRYHSWEYKRRVERESPNVDEADGYSILAKRYGQYTEQWIARDEVEEFGLWPGFRFKNLDPRTNVMSIYGSRDQHVPTADTAYWANMFSPRHELWFVEHADHNFYGRDWANNKINYNPLVVDRVCKYLQPDHQSRLFFAQTEASRSIPRWPKIDGVFNFRDFGYDNVRPGILFRSATLEYISDEGSAALRDLGIKRVFDLRSDLEAKEHPTPPIDGVTVIRNPVNKDTDLSPESMAEISALMADPNGGFTQNYLDILRTGRDAFREIVTSLRDHPGAPILIHCAAGKDRTGIACALILLLVGVDRFTVASDYELTRIGWNERRELATDYLVHKLATWNVTRDQARALLSSPYYAMQALVAVLDKEYGGVEHYFINHCGLTKQDLDRVRKNLLLPNSYDDPFRTHL